MPPKCCLWTAWRPAAGCTDMAMIFDSHAHYDDSAFDEDRDALLRSFPARGVEGVINCAVNAASARQSVQLAETYPHVWCAVGIHPEEAASATPEELEACLALATHPKAVAIGEIGLDDHYEDACPRDRQQYWFEQQLDAAVRLDLPVIVHDREAHEDTLNRLTKFRPRGVVHCFSGSVEMARQVIRLGLYIGIGGVVTFKNARKLVEVAAEIPLDRLLLETDAPYMAPVPHRGKRCDSTLIADTARVIADIRDIPVEQLLAQNRQNITDLFGIA